MVTETALMRVVDGMPAEHVSAFARVMWSTGIHGELTGRYTAPDSYSDIVTTLLRSERIVGESPAPSQAVAAVSERVSIACVRTVVGKDTDLFLGELGMSYLSSAAQSLTVNGSVIRSGRKVTMVAIDFKIRDTGKLVYTARATFYTTATAKL